MIKVIYQIEGMSCQGCVGKVNAALDNLEGIIGYKVNLVEKQAEVNFDSEKLDEYSIQSTLKKTNFDISLKQNNSDPEVKKKSLILEKIKSVFN